MLPLRLSTRGDVELRPDGFLKLPYYQTIARNQTHQVTFASITSGLDFISNTTTASIPSQQDISPWTKHLIPGGCQISDSVDPITSSNSPNAPLNCSEACSNSQLLFGSLPTLANCIMISSAALTVQNSSLSLGSPTNATALAKFGLNSTDLITFYGESVVKDVIQCALASCSNYSHNELSTLHTTSNFGFNEFPLFSAVLSNYCDGFIANIDSDMAGPGVLISHISQSYLILFFFLVIKLFNSWPRKLEFLCGEAESRKQVRTPKWQKSLVLSKPNAALISATIEFHEAQPFFVLAMQAATLATASFQSLCSRSIHGEKVSCPALESVGNIARSIMSAEMVRTLAFDSVLPVLLGQSGLQRVAVKWWYTHLSTILVTSLAIIIQAWSRFPLTFGELFDHLKVKQPVSQFGNNPPLTVYCLESLPQLEVNQANRLSMSAMPSPVWIAGFVMAVLVSDMVVRDSRFRCLIPRNLRGDKFQSYRRLARAVTLLGHRVTWVCLDLGLVVCVVLHLQDLRRLTDGTGLLSKPELRSYGQVISAMIWAPVLVKYVYYNIFGVKSGFEGRMLKWYKVVNERAAVEDGQTFHLVEKKIA